MAEYYQTVNHDDEDDEEEFQEDDDDASDSYDEEEEDEEENQDNTSQSDQHYAVLNGHLTLNEEGRLVYSGTWCMKKDLELHDSLDEAEKKKTKFKLKSKQILGMNGKFDLLNPLSGEKKTRIIFMDGFFTTDKTDAIEPHRKIKERDVEIIFSQGVPMKRDQSDKEREASHACFVIKGKGMNDFGNFSLEGIYCPDSNDQDCQVLKCSKRYMFAASSKRRRDYDSEDDYVISEDEAAVADVEELIGLANDAALSVEALRRKYYGGSDAEEEVPSGTDDEELDRKMPAKKFKTAQDDDDNDDDSYNYKRGGGRGRGDDDDDDDGCGF